MNPQHIIWIILVILAVCLIGKLLKAPIKLAFKILLNALSGLIVLMIVNFLGSYIDIGLSINWFNCIIAGIFGIPGVVLLFVFQWAGIDFNEITARFSDISAEIKFFGKSLF